MASIQALTSVAPKMGEAAKTSGNKVAQWFSRTWTTINTSANKAWNAYRTAMAKLIPFFNTPRGEKVLLGVTITAATLLTVGLVALTALGIRSSIKASDEVDGV